MVDVRAVAGAGVELGVTDLASSCHSEEAAELKSVALDAGLQVAGARGAHAGEQASRAEGAKQAALQAKGPVALSRWVGVDLESGDLPLPEVLRKGDGAVADKDQVRTTGFDVLTPAAQLRGCLLTVGSTEVADVGEDERAVRRQVTQLDRAALGVEDGQVGESAGHVP